MLDCKELLFQGYETGRLIAVTPFVAKILEGAKNSVVFRPPNPWVMGLLSVFKALYDVEDLKMNIKFEVEVLCKNLNVKLDEINKRDDLNNRVSPNKEKNPDFNTKSSSASSSSAPSSAPAPGADKGTEQVRPPPPTSNVEHNSLILQVQEQTVIPNLAAYVQINPSLALFNANPNLKRVVPVAVDRAIREIIQPVVERSVTIACITSKELIVKDFAMESDENKMRKAAQLMVSNLCVRERERSERKRAMPLLAPR
jgi:CCR4-NOT transcription complex subunit 1